MPFRAPIHRTTAQLEKVPEAPPASPRRRAARAVRALRHGRVLRAAITAVMSLPLLLVAAPADAAVKLPGGRGGYVVSMLSGSPNKVQVRLAKYQFYTNGLVVQEYWQWRQNQVKGVDQSYRTKPSSGYTTKGCARQCAIRTPVGFQSGKSGARLTGRFSVKGSVLTIRWSSTWVETWRINLTQKKVAGLNLITKDRTARGWGVGSRVGLARAVGIKDIFAAQRFYGPWAQNTYGSRTTYSNVGFNSSDNSLCGNGYCMQGKQVTGANKRTWYSSYWATNPAKDGRKVFRNHQTGAVQQMEAPGSVCISAGGGHTEAMLQVLNDDGRIIGLVGVEASLNRQRAGQAVVTAFAMVQPAYRSALG